jgi:hypothetical protein
LFFGQEDLSREEGKTFFGKRTQFQPIINIEKGFGDRKKGICRKLYPFEKTNPFCTRNPVIKPISAILKTLFRLNKLYTVFDCQSTGETGFYTPSRHEALPHAAVPQGPAGLEVLSYSVTRSLLSLRSTAPRQPDRVDLQEICF